VAFFALAGNDSLQPHMERYALCLVVPTVLALGVLLRELGGRGAHSWRPYALTAAVAALLLTGFWLRYFRSLEQTGSTSHETFWTGATEPKQEAFRRMLAEAGPRGGAQVWVETWWVYWPVAYLSAGGPLDVRFVGEAQGAVLPGGTYWLVFPDSPLDRLLAASRQATVRWEIPGAARPVALRVWWSPPPTG
jgi:hypothetical protein